MDKLTDFKSEINDLVESAVGRAYTDVLPYVLNDTEQNIAGIVSVCLEKIIRGDFKSEVSGEYEMHTLSVVDQNDVTHNVWTGSSNIYNNLVQAVFDKNREAIVDTRVKQLEAEIEMLKSRLSDAYRRY
jgi:hypothetical protein